MWCRGFCTLMHSLLRAFASLVPAHHPMLYDIQMVGGTCIFTSKEDYTHTVGWKGVVTEDGNMQ